jgi:hypothetical protein
MIDALNVKPAQPVRRDFALWSLSQKPGGLAMSDHETWWVPVDLFTRMPEELLIGSYINGSPYRHVVEGRGPSGDGYVQETLPGTEELVEVQQKVSKRTRRNSRSSRSSSVKDVNA